jgi:hypothetical protein
MTCGRITSPTGLRARNEAAVSHSAKLVGGNYRCCGEGPLIRPFRGTFSPRGEGTRWHLVVTDHCPSLSKSAGTCTWSAL